MSIVGEAGARRAHVTQLRFDADRAAWIVWACFALLIVIVRLDSVPSLENVFTIYREAGLRWLGGRDLYSAEFRFNYFPPSALLFAAWSWLPFQLGGALWRIANIAVFALGVRRLSRASERRPLATRFFTATVVTVVLSASAARYGQMTLAMSGFMMAAVADAEGGALWRAALYAALAVALKPLAVVLVLLLLVIYPRLSWRMIIALALVFLLPFLFQHPSYVWQQYAAVPDMLATRAGQQFEWQHVFGLLETLGWTATNAQETAIRGASALFVLFLCWRARRHVPDIGVALFIYALATCYILLFGSGTERNTYAMMTPVVGLLFATAWDARDRRLLGLMTAVIAIMLLSHTLQHAFPHTAFAMAKPVACLMLAAWLIWIALRDLRPLSAPMVSEGVGSQFLSFTTVGATGTAAHYATLIAAVSLGLGPVIASAIGCTVGATVNYVLNYHVTFRSRLAHRHSAPRFALIAVASLLLNTLLMAVGVLGLGLHYLVAQIVATGVVLCCNFVLSRIWAFNETGHEASS
jgi:alpha-1,2-mannosyltransferase